MGWPDAGLSRHSIQGDSAMLRKTLCRLGLAVLALGVAILLSPARGYASGGSTSSGGGGGGGGGSTTLLQTITFPIQGAYYGVGGSGSTVPSGTVSISFDSTQTTRVISMTITKLALPDGSVISGVMLTNGLVDLTGYYPVYMPQDAGNMIVSAGKATATFSTANGAAVPLFGTTGNITFNAYRADGTPIGFVGMGFYPANGGGGGGGGKLPGNP